MLWCPKEQGLAYRWSHAKALSSMPEGPSRSFRDGSYALPRMQIRLLDKGEHHSSCQAVPLSLLPISTVL